MPFLRGKIPSVLFWHFTDQFYHTDNDRIDKVSKATLKNVSVGALASAFELLNADEAAANKVLKELEIAALSRLDEELHQSNLAIKKGETIEQQLEIIQTWEDWYLRAAQTVSDMVIDQTTIQSHIQETQNKIVERVATIKKELNEN